MIIKIGTRASRLALAQSIWVKGMIETRYPDVKVELVKIRTTGDKILDAPLSKIGGKGLFVKEIEEALLEKSIDIAVHSMKDVPAELPKGLFLSTFPERENPQDAFVSLKSNTLEELPKGVKVGTSSLRRSAQLLHFRPDLEIVPLRGNVDTRLKKLESDDLNAIILAAAGLKRLGLSDRITRLISPKTVLPAVGQGALGLETRSDDKKVVDLLSFMNHKTSEITVRAERAVLKELGGGCQVPIAAFAEMNDNYLNVKAMVAAIDGTTVIRDIETGEKDDPEGTGIRLARKLLDAGAEKLLADVYT